MIPTEKELLEFVRKRDLVNFSLIAKHFDIKNATVADLVVPLQKKKLIDVKKLGGSKVVRLKNSKR